MTESEQAPAPRRAAGARGVAAYLAGLRVIMREATESRRGLVRQVGIWQLDANNRPPEMVAPTVAQASAAQLELFQDVRTRLELLEVPTNAAAPHEAALGWVDGLIEACQQLASVEVASLESTLRSAQRLIAETRRDLEKYDAAFTALVARLRERVEAKRRARISMRWPFGKSTASS
jgi:hypothetical protein